MDEAQQCRPLCTPQELLDWRTDAVDEVFKCCVPLPEAAPRAAGPRLLACHDMRGGYLEDRFVQGGTDSEFYVFRHWHAVDLFAYFSHRLVTIPPVGWVNSGHRHGVPVLGTLITEWEQGATYCRQLFGSPAAAEQTACQLAAIAWAYGFDGWVVNIENELLPAHVPHVIHCLRVLTGLLRAKSPAAEVVWYDAVTVEGELSWQNTLNDLNRPFFDACTAIWINYTWKEESPEQVHAAAGARRHDVFMGIDVFGRGTFGGGGLQSGVALRAAWVAGLSAALFAVAWPFDAEPEPGDDRSWRDRDEALWHGIASAWGGRRPLCTRLPLHTDFSLGAGRGMLHQGSLVDPCGWYNLSHQSLQPSLIVHQLQLAEEGRLILPPAALQQTPGRPPEAQDSCAPPLQQQRGLGLRAAPTLGAAYCGGSCVEVAGSVHSAQLVALFRTALPLPPGGLEVGYAVATCGEALPVLLLTLAASQSDSLHQPAWAAALAAAVQQQQQQQQQQQGREEEVLLEEGPSGGPIYVLLLPCLSLQSSMRRCLGLPFSGSQAAAPGSAARVGLEPVEEEVHKVPASGSMASADDAVGPHTQQQPQQQQQQQEEEGGGRQRSLTWVRRRYEVTPHNLPFTSQRHITRVDLLLLPLEEEGGSGEEGREASLFLGELWIQELGAM